jgi:hypothetical protein
VDVPTLDGVAFIDPKGSQTDIVQAVGRAIRKAEDKTVGTVVLPVFIDEEEDTDKALSSSAFKPIWSVLRALRDHDDVLAEELDEIRTEIGRTGRSRRPSRIEFLLPATIETAFAEALRTRIVERTTAAWEANFGVLLRFVDREGHALVPTDHREGSVHLGTWIAGQRYDYKRGDLSRQRAALLAGLPDWSWDPQEVAWEDGLGRLITFAKRHRTTRIPAKAIIDGFPLGMWVAVQRNKARKGSLAKRRKIALEDVPHWVWDPREAGWREHFDLLTEYVSEYGDSNVRATYRARGRALGKWVSKQRSKYRNGSLSPERAELLADLPGWSWHPKTDEWEEGFARLAAFAVRETHVRVPHGHVEGDTPLDRWVVVQRREHAQGRMPPERAARLEALPGWSWDPFSERWEIGLACLHDYARREGHARVPRHHIEGSIDLGQWVVTQRSAQKRGRLSTDRATRLESVPGWTWNVRDARWEQGLEALRRFAQREGHALVPVDHVEEGVNLGSWARTQRHLRNRGRLPHMRVTQLEAVPGWTWTPPRGGAAHRARRENGAGS